MVEIFGFWVSASILTAIVVFPVFIMTIWFLSYAIKQVTEDDLKGKIFFHKYCFDEDKNPGKMIFVQKIEINSFLGTLIVMVPFVISAIVVLGFYMKTHGYDDLVDYIIYVISTISTNVAVYVGWAIVLFVSYKLIIFGLRKCYRFYLKVERVLSEKG